MAATRLTREIATAQAEQSRAAAGKASVRPRLEAEIAALVAKLLPLLNTYGLEEMKAFRITEGRYGSFFPRRQADRAGWMIASAHKDSSWGGTTVLFYLLTNGRFMQVVDTSADTAHDSGGHTTGVKDLVESDLDLIRRGLRSELERYQRKASELG